MASLKSLNLIPLPKTGSNPTFGHFDDWVGRGLSDHVPLVVDIDEVKIEGFERKYISLVDNASHVADV